MNSASSLRPFATAAVLTAAFCTATLSAAPVRTPSLTDGPFYTFASDNTLPALAPANRDNDMTKLDGGARPAKGDLFLLSGVVRDLAGKPLAGVKVELWQTDSTGVYYHSGDKNAANRDPNFQHYGESLTDAQGRYAFRTVTPGLYTGRIRHFHFKVKQDDNTVLTSQFIFEEERAQFARDGVTARLTGEALEAIVIKMAKGADASGAPALLATKDIVVDPSARPTSNRGEGPPRGKSGKKQ